MVLAWSAVRPHDYFTWFMEVAPILIGVPILVATYRRFPLTPLLYRAQVQLDAAAGTSRRS